MKEERFVVDLARCTGCQACSIACKDRAGLPDDLDWLRVEARESGTYPHPSLCYRVTHCFHCDEPSCAEVCPTDAIAKTADGWVQIDGQLCVRCGACVEACPFAAIVTQPDGYTSKCDGCMDQVSQGWTPTCVRACPMRALQYGPIADALLERRTHDQAFDDHGIGPSVMYLRR